MSPNPSALSTRGPTMPEEAPLPCLRMSATLLLSGALVRLSPAAWKLLCTLGLVSSPLAADAPAGGASSAGPAASRPDDPGRLACTLSQRELARLSGLSKNTVSRCTRELARLGMLEQRPLAGSHRGRRSLFLLLPDCGLEREAARTEPAPEKEPDTLLDAVIALYEACIGPATPMIGRELASLLALYPDLDEWDAAFRGAAWANVLRLSYVVKVLEGRASRRASQ